MKASKKARLNLIISEIESGKSPAKISVDHNINKKTLQDYLRELKKLGIIEKRGYGVWTVNKTRKGSLNLTNRHPSKVTQTSAKKEIRGHAFIWKIEFMEAVDWSKAIKKYSKKKLTFQLMKHNKILRTIFKEKKIWLGARGLTIYEPIDFMGESSFEVKGRAVFEMDLLIKDLLRELGVRFRRYRFTTSREHYGIVKNELARQYNDRKEKMLIKTLEGSTWLWIDDSKGLGELETADPTLNREVQNFWNNHKKHKFKHDGDYIDSNFKESAKQIKQNAKNLDYHAENMRSHIGAVRSLSAGVETQNKLFERIADTLDRQNKFFDIKISKKYKLNLRALKK